MRVSGSSPLIGWQWQPLWLITSGFTAMFGDFQPLEICWMSWSWAFICLVLGGLITCGTWGLSPRLWTFFPSMPKGCVWQPGMANIMALGHWASEDSWFYEVLWGEPWLSVKCSSVLIIPSFLIICMSSPSLCHSSPAQLWPCRPSLHVMHFPSDPLPHLLPPVTASRCISMHHCFEMTALPTALPWPCFSAQQMPL